MAPIDHRLALSRPALLSAPDKKSFSSVSSPILACSVLTSIAGGGADAEVVEPNRPQADSTTCVFQAVIWFGCTSYCCANSASVFSPLIAASATLALKPGAWVRRVRLLMLAPDPRHPRRSQAEVPLIGLSEFGRPALTKQINGPSHFRLRAIAEAHLQAASRALYLGEYDEALASINRAGATVTDLKELAVSRQ